MTQLLIDTGDISEDLEIVDLAKSHGSEIWGATTNPTKISQALAGKIVTSSHMAFSVIQRHIVHNILETVPGAVSAEVYADHATTANEMVQQGQEIASWDNRVVVKLPTTLEGFKARSELRKQRICINNTLVFSQEQVFAIALHEKLMLKMYGPSHCTWPSFISPFVGRLDDKGLDGLSFIRHAQELLARYFEADQTWLLVASIRNSQHMKDVLSLNPPLITAPARVYRAYFEPEHSLEIIENKPLTEIPAWTPTPELLEINSLDAFYDAITSGTLNILHELTSAGIDKFVHDWNTLINPA